MIRLPQTGADTAHGLAAPDLTPLVDVLFTLLMFFILTANAAQHALDLQLPVDGEGAVQPVAPVAQIAVGLPKQGAPWRVNGQGYADWSDWTAAMLAARMAQPAAPIVVAGDREVPLERLLKVLAFLQAQGWSAAEVLMATEADTNTVSTRTSP